MEELRDERLGKIVTWMQSWVRGYLSRKEFKKLQEQRLALQVCQRNLRKYLKLRTWPWYKLWQKVKPLLNVTRIEDEIAVCITFLCHSLLLRQFQRWWLLSNISFEGKQLNSKILGILISEYSKKTEKLRIIFGIIFL